MQISIYSQPNYKFSTPPLEGLQIVIKTKLDPQLKGQSYLLYTILIIKIFKFVSKMQVWEQN